MLAAVAAMVVCTLLFVLPWLPVRLVIALGALVFVVVRWFHPDFWYRRLTGMLLGAWIAIAGLPALYIFGQWTETRFVKFLIQDTSGWVHMGFAVAFVASLIVTAIMESKRQRQHDADAPAHVINPAQHTHQPSEPAVQQAQRVNPSYAPVTTTLQIEPEVGVGRRETFVPSLETVIEETQGAEAVSPALSSHISTGAITAVSHFEGRSDELARLDRLLKDATTWASGTRLIMTTRALPRALEGRPYLMIGDPAPGGKRVLGAFDLAAAVRLLQALGVKATERKLVAAACGNHAFALRVLAGIIAHRYGGDLALWQTSESTRPEAEDTLGGLLDQAIDRHRSQQALLSLIAVAAAPPSVALLSEVLGDYEARIRQQLVILQDWQLIEFDGSLVTMHTLLIQRLRHCTGQKINY